MAAVRLNGAAGMIDGFSAIALAAYLAVVLWNGRAGELATLVKSDAVGFLEFVIAIYVLILLANYGGTTGKVVSAFVTLAILGLALRTASTVGSGPFVEYGKGQIGLFQLILKLGENVR